MLIQSLTNQNKLRILKKKNKTRRSFFNKKIFNSKIASSLSPTSNKMHRQSSKPLSSIDQTKYLITQKDKKFCKPRQSLNQIVKYNNSQKQTKINIKVSSPLQNSCIFPWIKKQIQEKQQRQKYSLKHHRLHNSMDFQQFSTQKSTIQQKLTSPKQSHKYSQSQTYDSIQRYESPIVKSLSCLNKQIKYVKQQNLQIQKQIRKISQQNSSNFTQGQRKRIKIQKIISTQPISLDKFKKSKKLRQSVISNTIKICDQAHSNQNILISQYYNLYQRLSVPLKQSNYQQNNGSISNVVKNIHQYLKKQNKRIPDIVKYVIKDKQNYQNSFDV